jgi:DNA-binding transcriptional regulator YhcF (GntR family)
MVTAKIDANHNTIRRARDLDDLARILFPNNKNHQRAFLAIYIELKWADDQFLPTLAPTAEKHSITRRTLQTVRAKMRRLGLIDHISRFNKRYGYREGWTFSKRYAQSFKRLIQLAEDFGQSQGEAQEMKDRACLKYV